MIHQGGGHLCVASRGWSRACRHLTSHPRGKRSFRSGRSRCLTLLQTPLYKTLKWSSVAPCSSAKLSIIWPSPASPASVFNAVPQTWAVCVRHFALIVITIVSYHDRFSSLLLLLIRATPLPWQTHGLQHSFTWVPQIFPMTPGRNCSHFKERKMWVREASIYLPELSSWKSGLDCLLSDFEICLTHKFLFVESCCLQPLFVCSLRVNTMCWYLWCPQQLAGC